MSAQTGGCACGGVRYRITGELRPVVACHCETCRRTSGHHVAATACDRDALNLEGADALTWWASSPGHRRGFCNRCGGNLFWEREGNPTVSVMAGSMDGPTGLRISRHIFTVEKGDYYEISPGPPETEVWPENAPGEGA